jgi:hypothetical protein
MMARSVLRWQGQPSNAPSSPWRECHDTLLYAHPEWEEGYLERMTKRCMDDRLLRQSVR